MLRSPAVAFFCLLFLSASRCICAAEPTTEKWKPLFDGKSLSGWYVFIGGQKKNEDPAKVFQVHNGEIHVYADQPAGTAVKAGYIATDGEYSNYHLRLEYKWGEKKFKPRENVKRDAGLLYHVLPPDVVWPRSVECQIQEGDTGDCFAVRGTRVTTTVEEATIDTPRGPQKLPRYKPTDAGGIKKTVGGGGAMRVVKSDTVERDGWNTVEVIIQGDKLARHIINGKTVFEATDLQQPTDAKEWEPLTQGRIALQAEFAEVFYRNIEIRPIPEGPLQPSPTN